MLLKEMINFKEKKSNFNEIQPAIIGWCVQNQFNLNSHIIIVLIQVNFLSFDFMTISDIKAYRCSRIDRIQAVV